AACRQLGRSVDARLDPRLVRTSAGRPDVEAERHLELLAARQEIGPPRVVQARQAVDLGSAEHGGPGREAQLDHGAPEFLLRLVYVPPGDLRQRQQAVTALSL